MSDKRPKIAWIDVIPEDEASSAVQRAYKRSADTKSGKVDHIMKIHSLNPESLLDHLHLYKTLMHAASPLSKAQREMIAVVVSVINRCEY